MLAYHFYHLSDKTSRLAYCQIWLVFVGFLTTLYSTIVVAQTPEPIWSSCVACHGKQGQGNEAMVVPSIAGLSQSYIQRQLEHFKTGERKANPAIAQSAAMVQLAQTLSDQQIAELSLSISQLSPANRIVEFQSADISKGQTKYHGSCGVCHGSNGQGNEKFSAPRLTPQSISYLQAQILGFKQQQRGFSRNDKYGRQMAMMAQGLTEQDITNVLAYLAQQAEQ